ncbi:MAG: response regulator transcription factor [Pseudomonadota bacterium]
MSIVIADDHPLVRSALKEAVRRVAPEAEIVEAQSVNEARQVLADKGARLLLLDLHMSDSDGFAGLVAFRQDFPALPVIVVSAHEELETVNRAMAFGASGYVPKSLAMPRIAEAINAVLAGDIWTPLAGAQPEYAPPDGAVLEDVDRLASLTPAQLRVLVGLSLGRLNKQIAYDMGISEATVKAHVTAVFRKLGVINRTQAVLAAKALQLAPVSTPP